MIDDICIRHPIYIPKTVSNNHKLSIIYITYRPGGMDVLCNSLKRQTYKDYELIVVDDYPNRDLKEYFDGNGIPITYYGPSKEKHYKDTPFGQVNAFNTGILKATGDVVVFMSDYVWLESNSLERWNQVYNVLPNTVLCTAPAIRWKYKHPDKIGDISVWDEDFNGDFSKCSFKGLSVTGIFDAFPFDWEYSAMPMYALEKMNGMDERFDYGLQYLTQFFPIQCRINNFKFFLDIDHIFHVIDHREWNLGGEDLWDIVNKAKKITVSHTFDFIYAYNPNNFNIKELRE